jgi:hypothetical protein
MKLIHKLYIGLVLTCFAASSTGAQPSFFNRLTNFVTKAGSQVFTAVKEHPGYALAAVAVAGFGLGLYYNYFKKVSKSEAPAPAPLTDQERLANLLRLLREEVERDLFTVEAIITCKVITGQINLGVFGILTNNNDITLLDVSDLEPVKAQLLFIAGYATEENYNQATLNQLHDKLVALRAAVEEQLKK